MKNHPAGSQNKHKGLWVPLIEALGDSRTSRTSKLMVFQWHPVRSGAMQICMWAPSGKPCSRFCRRRNCCSWLINGNGYHWTSIEQPVRTIRWWWKRKERHHERSTGRCSKVWHGVTRSDILVKHCDMEIFLQPLSCSETYAEKAPPGPRCLWGGPVACLVTVPGGWHGFSRVDHHKPPAPCG